MEKKNVKDLMFNDIALQIIIVLVMAISFLFMNDIPNKLFSKLRLRNRKDIQAKHHFVQGAQLFAKARSSSSSSNSNSKSRSIANSLSKQALAEAEKAIALDPNDAAVHLLKSLVLDLQGFRTSALESIDVALSPIAAKSLSESERGDAHLMRAELKMRSGKGKGKGTTVKEDLEEAVRLNPKNARAFCVLGEWYEGKKMKDEALKAYEEAIGLEPELRVAQDALNRMRSSS
ncbi:hypothetical protein RIF29_16976 [Crotalaria pallida]|uniref:Uncharacterized protein n=1 Tax=Crotalaria pallida TaxID=3830 RepID=A0AAN9FM31_CROPI